MTPFTRAALPALLIGGAAGALLMGMDRPADPASVSADDASTGLTVAVDSTTASTAATTTTESATTAGAGTTGDTTATTTATADAACTAVTGPTVDTRYGPLQVAASVSSDGSICDVEVLQYPSGDRKSLAINQRALPTLIEATLSAQSADVDTVSGATYTSNAYRQSLQAILDSVGG